MQFLAPTLLCSLALVPVYVWLRLRQRRPPVAVVSSLLLWKAVPPAPRETLARRERLWNLVLLIEGLSFALVCAALARPFVLRESTRPIHLVLGLDDSASMGAHDRWERALKRATDLLDGLEEGDVVTLLTSRMEIPRAAPGKVRLSLLGVAPTAAEDDLDGLLARARAIAAAEEGAVVRLLTDRSVPDAPEVESVGGPVDNAGIIDASCDGKEVFALVAATSPRRVVIQGPSGSRVEAAIVDDRPTPVVLALTTTVALGPEGFSVRLTAPDALSFDDEVTLARGTKARVAIETPGNPELVRAISVQPGVEVVLGSAREADLVVFDRTWPGRRPSVPSVIIAPPEGCPYRGQVVEGPIATWDANHSLLDGLDADAVGFSHGIGLNLDEIRDPWVPIATADGKPILAYHLGIDGFMRGIYVGFDVSLAGGQTTWATHPHFPVFWNRVVRELTRERGGGWSRSGLCSRKETLCASLSTPSRPVDFARTRVVSSPRFVTAQALAAAALGFAYAFLLAKKANGWRSSSSSTTR